MDGFNAIDSISCRAQNATYTSNNSKLEKDKDQTNQDLPNALNGKNDSRTFDYILGGTFGLGSLAFGKFACDTFTPTTTQELKTSARVKYDAYHRNFLNSLPQGSKNLKSTHLTMESKYPMSQALKDANKSLAMDKYFRRFTYGGMSVGMAALSMAMLYPEESSEILENIINNNENIGNNALGTFLVGSGGYSAYNLAKCLKNPTQKELYKEGKKFLDGYNAKWQEMDIPQKPPEVKIKPEALEALKDADKSCGGHEIEEYAKKRAEKLNARILERHNSEVEEIKKWNEKCKGMKSKYTIENATKDAKKSIMKGKYRGAAAWGLLTTALVGAGVATFVANKE